MSYRAIIAEDEPLARERVRAFLAEEPDVEVVGECAEGAAAVRSVEELRPDILFLDVQMPRLNGFEVLEALDPGALPVVIFTTAHDQHAIRAFEVNAVDYLLKPYKSDRFKKALERARRQLALRTSDPGKDTAIQSLLAHLRPGTEPNPRILVKSPDRILFVKPQEIDYIEADGNYVQLHVGTERHMIRETMAAMESRLVPAGFMRVSRSHIVNLTRIKELKPVAAGQYNILLRTGARLEMTCPLRDLQDRLAHIG
ncbi:MAG TPA: LytTR family DNA-binding domain-containing protein [Candidatus Limnocylindria bacterium]|nr:LytTR family DNA-binding domain-containing protein [Candidatus Limnocylindria bacterium]